MRYKLSFGLGFAAGYVLGAKAGRERYEQIMRAARQFSESPAVQGAAGVLQEQASEFAQTAKAKVMGHNGHDAEQPFTPAYPPSPLAGQ